MKNSKIEWTDNSWNPWLGCTKVSPGCTHCYAETLNKRFGWTQWGDGGERFRTGEHNWNEPRRWNKAGLVCVDCGAPIRNSGVAVDCECGQAGATGKMRRARVFCASLSDWLDYKAPTQWRVDLLGLIAETPNLDWLLLTKRPESWNARMHEAMGAGSNLARTWLNGMAPANVWIGTSIEDQKRADERMPILLEIPARVRFLSIEPLLEDLGELNLRGIHWVIVGGESGPGARPMNPEWVRSIRDQCYVARVPFFFKQWGGVRKEKAGRILDKRTFDEFPSGDGATGSGRCPLIKWGEYNKLTCVLEAGHSGECCWVAVHEPKRRERYEHTRRALSAPNIASQTRPAEPLKP